MSHPLLSIIVPVGPGDEAWRQLWSRLPVDPYVEKMLVIPEGCAVPECEDPRSVVISAPRGRASQLNAGLRAARGPTVWLLHADSLPDARACEAALTFAKAQPRCLGYFRLGFHDGPSAMALNAWGANLRSRWLGMPFGDQGFLAPAALFLELGGFDERIGRGEDHALVWAVHRAGIGVRCLPGRVATSARRYVDHGWWRTTCEHLRLSWQQRRAFRRGSSI